MAYTILNTDGTTLLLLPDGRIDQSSTNLTLIGRNYSNFGEHLNNNFIKLLANSANTSANPPRNPLKGQLWYDTSNKQLKVYDNGFKSISGAIVSGNQPTNLGVGDLWWDSTNDQLKVWKGGTAILIGPIYSKSSGPTGWILPSTSIKDNLNNIKKVTVLKNYGENLGMISATSFQLSNTDSALYFNTSTQSIVKGLTISGDIRVTGTVYGAEGPVVGGGSEIVDPPLDSVNPVSWTSVTIDGNVYKIPLYQ